MSLFGYWIPILLLILSRPSHFHSPSSLIWRICDRSVHQTSHHRCLMRCSMLRVKTEILSSVSWLLMHSKGQSSIFTSCYITCVVTMWASPTFVNCRGLFFFTQFVYVVWMCKWSFSLSLTLFSSICVEMFHLSSTLTRPLWNKQMLVYQPDNWIICLAIHLGPNVKSNKADKHSIKFSPMCRNYHNV